MKYLISLNCRFFFKIIFNRRRLLHFCWKISFYRFYYICFFNIFWWKFIYIFTYSLMSIIFEADKVWKEPLSIVPSTRNVHLVNFFFVFSKKWRCTPRLLPNKIFPRIFDYLFSFVSCVFLSTNRFPLYAVFNAEQREFHGIGTDNETISYVFYTIVYTCKFFDIVSRQTKI